MYLLQNSKQVPHPVLTINFLSLVRVAIGFGWWAHVGVFFLCFYWLVLPYCTAFRPLSRSCLPFPSVTLSSSSLEGLMVDHAEVCQAHMIHDPRYCYLLLAGVGALCIGGRSCLGVSNSDTYVIRAFPSVSSLPVVCVEVVRAKLTSLLLQVTSATHSAKLSLLDPHLAAFLLAFHLGLSVCHSQNPSTSSVNDKSVR